MRHDLQALMLRAAGDIGRAYALLEKILFRLDATELVIPPPAPRPIPALPSRGQRGATAGPTAWTAGLRRGNDGASAGVPESAAVAHQR